MWVRIAQSLYVIWSKCFLIWTDSIRNTEAGQKTLLVIKSINEFPDNNEKLYGTIDVWWIVHILVSSSVVS